MRRVMVATLSAMAVLATGWPATASAALPPTCQPRQLHAAVTAQTGATGHLQDVIAFRNTAPSSCRLFGYPGLQLLAAGRRALPTRVLRGGGFTFPTTRPRTVILPPGGAASFDLDFEHIPGSTGTSCPMSRWLAIIPPGDYTAAVLDLGLDPCGGVVHVSPVVAGRYGVA